MKKILLSVLFVVVTLSAYTQALSYHSLAILFSGDQQNGTARFNALGGAFGALGSDISAIGINPAGGVVARNSFFSTTLGSRNTDINATYYRESIKKKNDFFTLSQIGGTFIFDAPMGSDWSRFALSFNYNVRLNFNNSFLASGNSGFSSFFEFPLDKTTYNNADNQTFSRITNGKLSDYTIGFSSVYKNKLFIGMAANISNLNYGEQNFLAEQNYDSKGNTLKADFYQENNIVGSGLSLHFGILYKALQNMRFGVSYQTPTWFSELTEESNIFDKDGFYGNVKMETSTNKNVYTNFNGYLTTLEEVNTFTYRLKTPGKLTLSAAFLFGKRGLVSIDYAFKSYKNIELSNGNFTTENRLLETTLRNTSTVNIGAEWRIKQFSLRTGYRYAQSPDKNAIGSDNFNRYSYGLGYDFGTLKIDLAYSIGNHTGIYNFYPTYDNVTPASLKTDIRNFTATIRFAL